LIKKERQIILNVIIKSAALLYEIHALLNEVVAGSGRISEIVTALKNYSFLDRDAMEQINVHSGIDNTLVILRSKLKKGIQVNKNYAPDLKDITAVGRELNQVWTNIIDNAVDALGGQGEITITTRNEEDAIVVQIENNGPQIPKKIQTKIFDPFFTTKEPGKGIGLGLSTSYSIVTEKQKGSITVMSDKDVTCFEVRLPIRLSNQEL
jgi:signal transduction histidine kinase